MTPEQKSGLIKGIIFLAVVVLLVAGYFIVRSLLKTQEERTGEAVQKALEAPAAGILPEINPVSNPLEKLPEVNPIERANPFKDIQTNPWK